MPKSIIIGNFQSIIDSGLNCAVCVCACMHVCVRACVCVMVHVHVCDCVHGFVLTIASHRGRLLVKTIYMLMSCKEQIH